MRNPAYGYVKEAGRIVEHKEDMALLKEVKELVEQRAISLRDGAAWLSHKGSRTISHEGLNKRLKRPLHLYTEESLLGRPEEESNWP